MELIILFALVFLSIFGAWVARQKGRSDVEGAALGFLFGPLGILVEALLPNREPGGRSYPRSTGSRYHDRVRDAETEAWLRGLK